MENLRRLTHVFVDGSVTPAEATTGSVVAASTTFGSIGFEPERETRGACDHRRHDRRASGSVTGAGVVRPWLDVDRHRRDPRLTRAVLDAVGERVRADVLVGVVGDVGAAGSSAGARSDTVPCAGWATIS